MPEADVIVCGAGPAGITAALAAARNGAHTILIEKYGFAGGASTGALVYPWMSFHSSQGEQVIGGIAQEIVSHLIQRGASPGHLRDTIGFAYSLTPYDFDAYKLLVDELLIEAGVELAYHTLVTRVVVDENRIEALITSVMGVDTSFSGKVYIDSTGDGEVAAAAGVPFQNGRTTDGRAQPMTMNFVMEGIDLAEVKQYMQAHPEEFHPGSLIAELDHLPLTAVSGFFDLWKRYGPPEIPRDRVLFFPGIHPGQVVVNTTRMLNYDGTLCPDLTRAEIEGRKQVHLLVEFFRAHVPGFNSGYLVRTPTQIGVRETRHIAGAYTLTARDILSARRFQDGIARSGYPLDVHDPDGESLSSDRIPGGGWYEIPYRCLLPQRMRNLLVNGRCASTTHTASSSARLTPSCMAIGQAAGSAAALAVKYRQAPSSVDVGQLRCLLRKQGAILG
ncbi:MAG: FAD-dependent oxidoreductase [Anaerolineaceae bacterium]|nr:FAD-dependent oxidoreductase [Anaerolineaceae bacterium]